MAKKSRTNQLPGSASTTTSHKSKAAARLLALRGHRSAKATPPPVRRGVLQPSSMSPLTVQLASLRAPPVIIASTARHDARPELLNVRSPSGKPRILILADTPNWAWQRKAKALQTHLADRFEVSIVYTTEYEAFALAMHARQFDLVHTFDAVQVEQVPTGVPLVTGITAHVWPTWDKRQGTGTVRRWASRALAFHANSRLLQKEMQEYLGRNVWYVPNGVDEVFWHRTRPRNPSQRLVVGHVARPNPRKGADIVAEACRLAGAELRTVSRNSKTAMPAEEMREFYQDLHVLAVSSDMDGTPNPALEAAACGVAVVSNRIGNMPEFIEHGINGLITERTTASLAEALWSLTNRPIAEVEEMGQAARRTIEDAWTWKTQAENYAAMWSACVENRS